MQIHATILQADTLVRICSFQVLNLLKTLYRIGRTNQTAANIESKCILYSSSYGQETDKRPMQNKDICNENIAI